MFDFDKLSQIHRVIKTQLKNKQKEIQKIQSQEL